MRVSSVAWLYDDMAAVRKMARISSEPTHNHPEGIKGAEVTAGAVFLARAGATVEQIRSFVECFYALDFTIDGIRPTYRFNETCQDTVPQAMEAFLESTSFEDCIRTGVSVGGDTDTLCAICGAVAEAYYGLTDTQREAALSRLDAPLREVAEAFSRRYTRGE
jgi:type I restriction enzyme M protein